MSGQHRDLGFYLTAPVEADGDPQFVADWSQARVWCAPCRDFPFSFPNAGMESALLSPRRLQKHF